jgi:hypothetical protein
MPSTRSLAGSMGFTDGGCIVKKINTDGECVLPIKPSMFESWLDDSDLPHLP